MKESLRRFCFRKILFSIFLIFLSLTAAGQDPFIDSLKTELELHTDQDTTRVNMLMELGRDLISDDPDAAESYLNEAIALANEIQFGRGKALSFHWLAVIYYYRSRCDTVYVFLDSAETTGKGLNISRFLPAVINLRAFCQEKTGDYELAISSYLTLLKDAQRNKDKVIEASTLLNIGVAYEHLNQKDQAKRYYFQSLPLKDSLDDINGLATLHVNLGAIYFSSEQFDSALYHTRLACRFRIESETENRLGSPYTLLGTIFEQLKVPDSAEHYLQLGIENSVQYQFPEQEAEARGEYAGFLNRAGRAREAESQIAQSIDIAQSKNLLKEEIEGLKTQANIQAALGYHVAAFASLTRHVQLKDSVFDDELSNKVAFYQEKYQAEKRELELAQYRATEAENQTIIERQNLTQILYIGGLALMLIITGFIVWTYLKSRKVNALLNDKNKIISSQVEKLTDRNQQLEGLNREKDGLIGIVAHDLKTPLNQSLGLIHLMETDEDIAPAHHQYLEMMKKVNHRGMDLIQDLLNLEEIEGDSPEIMRESKELTEELTAILAPFQQAADKKNIELNMNFLHEAHVLTLAWGPYQRIVENLVSNALKFSQSGTQIQVTSATSPGQVILEVLDQGPGISVEDQQKLFGKFQKLSARPTGNEHSSGLGLAIVKSLIDKLHGTIEVESEVGKGTLFRVTLPEG